MDHTMGLVQPNIRSLAAGTYSQGKKSAWESSAFHEMEWKDLNRRRCGSSLVYVIFAVRNFCMNAESFFFVFYVAFDIHKPCMALYLRIISLIL